MRVFITGIAGFVGSSLAQHLNKKGYTVRGCDNLKFGDASRLKDIVWDNRGMETYTESELSVYDVVVHCACDNIIYAINYPVETFNTNALKSISFLNKYRGKVIYTSTASVYGNAMCPANELASLNTYNAYDTSKLITEKYLVNRGNYTTLRLSNVYGANQKNSHYAGVVGKLCDMAKSNIPLTVYGTGEQTRDFTYIDDVVNAIEISVNLSPTNDVFNISTMEETSVKRIVDIISTYIPNVSLEYVEGRSIDGITRRCLDNTKAKKILEWSPSVSIVEGIESILYNNHCKPSTI